MALARVHSFVLSGIDALPCDVEVDVSQRGKEKTTIVGLAQTAVKESIERTRRAIQNSGHPAPYGKVLINLAPFARPLWTLFPGRTSTAAGPAAV